MPFSALAVHQLRYDLAYGVHAHARLARDGHAYLGAVEPLVLMAAALAAGLFVGRFARRCQQRPVPAGDGGWRLPRVWAVCAAALLAIYCGQELLEGMLASGHPAGLAGIVGHGGWIAVPAAVLIGGALAAALRIAEVLIGRIAGPVAPRRRRLAGARLRARHALCDWRLEPLSALAAGRAPPHPARP